MKISIAPVTEIANNIIETIEKKNENESNYLFSFNRQIDPVILGVFYGFYISKELPPLMEDKINLPFSKEFNADITSHGDILNHMLFCLWLQKYGVPNDSVDILQYRKNLYDFIKYIIDPKYYRDVLIPFYLKKACEEQEFDPSFMWKIWNSGEIGVINVENSPEFLSLIFSRAQESFLKDVIFPLKEKMEKNRKN